MSNKPTDNRTFEEVVAADHVSPFGNEFNRSLKDMVLVHVNVLAPLRGLTKEAALGEIVSVLIIAGCGLIANQLAIPQNALTECFFGDASAAVMAMAKKLKQESDDRARTIQSN